MKSIGKGTASGKIILMGEHSVVYGQPAIALPFYATKVTAAVEEAPDNEIVSSYFRGRLSDVPPALTCIRQLMKKLQEYFSDPDGVHLTISSSIPPERGMGSSAAVAVALTRGFFDYHQVELTDERLLHFVDFSEKIAHGNPSGIDAAATSGANPIYFIKGKTMDAFLLNIDAYLIVADTGIKGQTREAVADVAQLMKENEATTSEHIRHLGKLANEAKEAIIKNDPSTLGSLMNQAHQALQKLTVSNGALDQLAETALAHGALGSKLTGGGRGGCLITLAEDRRTAEKIADAQEKNGAVKTWIQKMRQ